MLKALILAGVLALVFVAEGLTMVGCHGKVRRLQCGKKYIRVMSASWGRDGVRPDGKRPTCGLTSKKKIERSGSLNVSSIIYDSCDGKKSCAIKIGNRRLGKSPLKGSYLTVDFKCLAKKPLKWTVTKTNATAPHQLSCSVTFHDRLLIIGHRFRQPTRPIKGGIIDVDMYNPSTGKWTALKGPPVKLHHINCGVDTKRDLIVTGMAFVYNSYPRELPYEQFFQYSPKQGLWKGIKIPKGRRRGSASFAYWNGYYYFIYGTTYGHGQGASTTKPWFDRYDPDRKVWKIMPNAPLGVRDHAGGVVYKSKLFVLCGKWGGQPDFPVRSWYDVNYYDLLQNKWHQVRTAKSYFSFPHVSVLATLVNWNGRDLMAVAGGVHNYTTRDETEFFDPNTFEVLPWDGLRLQSPRTAFQMISCRGSELYVLGGKFFASEKVLRDNIYSGEYILFDGYKKPKCGNDPSETCWHGIE